MNDERYLELALLNVSESHSNSKHFVANIQGIRRYSNSNRGLWNLAPGKLTSNIDKQAHDEGILP